MLLDKFPGFACMHDGGFSRNQYKARCEQVQISGVKDNATPPDVTDHNSIMNELNVIHHLTCTLAQLDTQIP